MTSNMATKKIHLFILFLFLFVDQTYGNLSKIEITQVNLECSFAVTIGKKLWLESSKDLWISHNSTVFSTTNSSLAFVGASNFNGQDAIGKFKGKECAWKTKTGLHWITSIKDYGGGVYQFQQTFPDGAKNSNAFGSNGVASTWPSFKVDKSAEEELGFFAWGMDSFGDDGKKFGLWGTNDTKRIASGLDSGPLLLMNKRGDTIVLSHSSQFMVTSASYNLNSNGQGTVSWGILGSIKDIPAHFSSSVIMVFADGPGKALRIWGDNLRGLYGKARKPGPSFQNDYLGYWTDNGAYFYYNTLKNKTYEESLYEVYKYSQKAGIPYRYLQIDSWWYYKSDGRQGVVNWIPQPGYFPSGLLEFSKKTNWQYFAHNRWFSANNVYAKQNGGKYNFVVERDKDIALPQDETFWKDFFYNATQWGLRMYLQDWLTLQFDKMSFTKENITAARTWLLQLDEALQFYGLPTQLCMTPCRTALQVLELKSITNVRVSTDYLLAEQWRIGLTSHFAWNVGVFPNKDNFFSQTIQPGNPFKKKEPYPALHAVVSTLSMSQVAPGDGVGMSNVSLLLRTCNADGLILSPCKPALSVDEQFVRSAFRPGKAGEVTATHSIVSKYRFGIVLAADVPNDSHYQITTDMVDADDGVYWLDGKHSTLNIFSKDYPISVDYTCTKANFCLYHTSPIFKFNGDELILIGETAKFVPMSAKRFSNIRISSEDFRLDIRGSPNEKVIVSIYSKLQKNIDITCILPASGQSTLSFILRNCY
ncbi:unnamed protein product [Dimorphilus gyrociliatus]|uniref:Uncharacterized protein n=1 Tax=Dimorphilus gyrociliatus TaxID=2664684 RepID=A0A7I8V6P3_9ANNE|nr:unnamed protein product [Dimorphilus gyrociliatus]